MPVIRAVDTMTIVLHVDLVLPWHNHAQGMSSETSSSSSSTCQKIQISLARETSLLSVH